MDEAARVTEAEAVDERARSALTDTLTEVLAPFRARKVTNADVLKALASGTKIARARISDTLEAVRLATGVRSYLRQGLATGQVR